MSPLRSQIVLFGILLIFSASSFAQSRNYRVNQYMFYQPSINPAAQASYSGLNGYLFYRNQWSGLEGSPRTYGLHIATPLEGAPITLGGAAYFDQLGAHSRIEISIPATFEVKVKQNSRLAFGLSYNYNNFLTDLNNLDAQHQSDPTKVNSTDITFFNFKFGTYYYQNNFYAGFAISELAEHTFSNEPVVDYFSNNGGQTYLLHVGGAIYTFSSTKYSKNKFNNTGGKHVIWGSTLLRAVANQPVNAIFNVLYEIERSFGVGLSYATSNEWQALVRAPIIPNLQLAYSYQYTTSDIPFNSSHEVMLILNKSSSYKQSKRNLIIPRF